MASDNEFLLNNTTLSKTKWNANTKGWAWLHVCKATLRRLRSDGHEFKASLGCTERPCLFKTKIYNLMILECCYKALQKPSRTPWWRAMSICIKSSQLQWYHLSSDSKDTIFWKWNPSWALSSCSCLCYRSWNSVCTRVTSIFNIFIPDNVVYCKHYGHSLEAKK